MVDNWTETTLEELCVPSGLVRGPFGGALKKEIFVSSGYKVYEQRNAIYATTEMGNYYITPDKYRELSRFAIAPGDFIVSCSGTIGCIYQLPVKSPAGVINQALLKITLDPKKIDADLFLQYFRSESFQKSIVDDIQGGAMKNLVGMDKFRRALFVIPTDPKEQRAIAAALSDADAYIAALEKLITKKRAVKQGAMQELLTGKRRLPGFSGEWVTKQFGDGVLKVGHGKSQHEIEVPSGKYPILATSGEIGRTDCYLYDKPSVLIGRKGTIDKPQYMDTHFWTIDTLFYTLVGDDHEAKYIYYLFCMIDWGSYNEASGVPSLSSKTIEDIEVTIPPKPEQTVIASILTDMDAEIDALTAKLNKAKHIKQEMMSELLTGRIRLVEQEATVDEGGI